MYYSSGNYEAFARPKKPADVDNKHAYIHRYRTGGIVCSLLSGA